MKNYLIKLDSIFFILGNKIKKKFFLAFFLLSLAGIFEMLSIAILIPVISFIFGDKTLLMDKFQISYFFEGYEMFYILIFSVFLVYIFKAVYLSCLDIFLQKLINFTYANVTKKLFDKYLNNSFIFFFNN